MVKALSRLYRERGLKFDFAISPSIHVACDRQDLQEIMANLLDNASKHAKSTVRLTASCDQKLRQAEIVIEDDGPGLPPEAHEVVFNIGERWDTQEAGSGLGLAIARDLARLYGGDIILGSSSLGGLTATLTLPAAVSRASFSD